MANNKRVNTKIRLRPISHTVAYLEISVDNGVNWVVADTLDIPAGSIVQDYTFPNGVVIDLDNSLINLRVRVNPDTTTTTTTTSTSTSSTSSTSSSSTSSTSSSTSSTTSSTTSTSTTTLATTTTTSTSSTSTTSSTTTSSTSTSTSTNSGGGNVYTITGTGSDQISINGSGYQCGDTIILKGTFKAVEFNNLNGCNGNPITITNPIGQVTTIGDIAWDGGSWSTALAFRNCHYIKLVGTSQSNFIIHGSEQGGATAYFDLAIVGLSDNFEVYNISIIRGGTGLYAKTEPVPGNTATYDPVGGPYTYLNNFNFHDITISATYNEATYVGHTGPYWDLTSNTQFNGTQAQFIPGHTYAEPKRLNNIQIYNIYAENAGADGIQTGACENMVIHHNEVFNHATRHDPNHNGGILVGGKSRNVEVYCNYVHDSWGELGQHYASGLNGSFLKIHNNLYENNFVGSGGNDGVTFKLQDSLGAQIYDNTIVQTGGNNMRMYTVGPHYIARNIFIQPRMAGGTISSRAYIYDEPGVTWTEGTGGASNGKYPDIATANVDPNNWYVPNIGSPATGKGYVRGVCDGTGTTTTTTSTTSSTTTSSTTSTSSTTAVTTTTTSTSSTSSTSTSSTSSTSTSSTSSTTSTSTTTIAGSASFAKVNGWWTGNPSAQYGWLYLPADYSPTGPALPFVIFLHGQGEIGTGSGAGGADDLLVAGPPKYLNAGDRPTGVVIFCPQTSINTWEPNWVESARAFMVSHYNVDASKFYLTGLSLGGSGTSKYVGTYPDRVAAYLVATGDTQYQSHAAGGGYLGPAGSVGGVRQCDVPGWFLSGMADTTTFPGGGYASLTAMNNVSPKPTYPFLVDIFWGLTHSTNLWDTKVYNRKNRTDSTGTSYFDYLDWFKQFKSNDLQNNATSFVVNAENSNDWNEYRKALRLVNKLSAGSPKTALLARLAAVKSTIQTSWKIVELSFGSTSVPGNINMLPTITSGQSVNNMIDIDGNATTIDLAITTNTWSGDISLGGLSSAGLANEYFGLPTEFFVRGYRIYKPGSPTETWTVTGLQVGKTYNIRFYPAFVSQATNEHRGVSVTSGAQTKTFDDEIQNTNRYFELTALTTLTGSLTVNLQPLISGQYGDLAGIAIYESIAGGTTTTTSTSTSSTSTSTSSTSSTTTSSTTSTSTTTESPTTTTSTSTTSTSSTSTSTTSSTTTSSTTSTSTTTIVAARFNFNQTAQSVADFNDVSGNPFDAQRTATDSATSIGVRSLGNGNAALWGSAGGNTSNNVNGEVGSNAEFPTNVLVSFWFSRSTVYVGNKNMEIFGLTPGATYDIHIMGSRKASDLGAVTKVMAYYCEDDIGTTSNIAYNAKGNLTTIQQFTGKIAKSDGTIQIGVFSKPSNDGTNDIDGYINGMIVIPQ